MIFFTLMLLIALEDDEEAQIPRRETEIFIAAMN